MTCLHGRAHDGGLDDLVGVPDRSFLALPDEASRAGDLLGAEVLGAVDGGNIATTKHLILLEVPAPLQRTEEVVEEGYNLFRTDLVEHLPHLGILRDGRDMEECLQIIVVDLILHSLLKLEQRGVLEEHHRKAAHTDVMHRIICLCLLAVIRNETEPFREHFS